MLIETSCLPVLRVLLSAEFGHLRDFANGMEVFISEQGRKAIEDFAKSTAGTSEVECFESLEWASEHFDALEHDLPRVLRYALFVQAYSLFEFELLGIADHHHRERKLGPPPAGLRGEGIQCAQKALKQAGVRFPDWTSDWQDIRVLCEIRNRVVHHSGFLALGTDVLTIRDEWRQENSAFVKRWGSRFSMDEAVPRFCFTPEFVSGVLNVFQSFLNELFDTLENEANRQRP